VKYLSLLTAFLLLAATAAAERPVVNLPPAMRHRNWTGPGGPTDGSCVFASIVYLLDWQGQHRLAEYVRTHYSGGEDYANLAAKLNHAGIRFAYTTGAKDVKFLEWAVKTHRGCGVAVQNRAHMICLVDLDSRSAILWDNNVPGKYYTVTRAAFLKDWLSSGSWAVSPVYTPSAPIK